MQLFAKVSRLSLALMAGLLLSSCGGGDPHAGLWKGTIDGNRQANAIVLGDGTYYMVYSKPGVSDLGGVYVGTGDFQGARFTAENGRDYNWEGKYFPAFAANAPVSGKLSARQSVSGTVTGAGAFSLTFKREHDDDARLSQLAGTFVGIGSFIGGNRDGVFTVTATGDVSSVINGCPILGKATPRSDANAFDLSISFRDPICAKQLAFAPFKGVVLYHADERRLEAAAVFDPGRTPFGQAIVFNGIRQ